MSVRDDMLKAVKEGKPFKAFDIWARGVGYQAFVQKCGLFLWTEYFPHMISVWSWSIPDSDFRIVGINRTLDGKKSPRVKRSWESQKEVLRIDLDWLSCKLTTRVKEIVLQDQIVELH